MYSMLIYKYLASASDSGVCVHDVEPSHCLRQGHTRIFNDKQHGLEFSVLESLYTNSVKIIALFNAHTSRISRQQ